MPEINDQLAAATARIDLQIRGGGPARGESVSQSALEMMQWLQYFRAASRDSCASEILDGARASIIEAIAYISLGLGRAALLSIRTQIDLFLSYTYFHDHPAEWSLVGRTGDGFVLRSQVYRYQEETNPGFTARIRWIEDGSGIRIGKLYQILSAHIHGQNKHTIPATNNLAEVVASDTILGSIVELQTKTFLGISNFLIAVYARHWTELPPDIVARAGGLLKKSQKPDFFAD